MLLLDVAKGILGLIIPVEGAVAAGLPEACLGDDIGEPSEVFGDVEESGGRPEKIAVEVLGPTHHQPCVVDEGIELIAGTESLLLGR